jgi:hypothetical protein
MGKVMGERRETGTFKDLLYLLIDLYGRTLARFSENRSCLNIFKDGHFQEGTDHLECAGYPEMTKPVRPHPGNRGLHEFYFSMGRAEKTTEESEEGCLASTVRSDYTNDLSLCDTKRYGSKGSQPSKVPGQVLYFKQR